MHIQFNSISIQSFKENALTHYLTENKIVVIATAALAALAATFLCLTRYVFPNEWLILKSYYAPIKGELNHDYRRGKYLQSERGTFKNGKLEGEGEKSDYDLLIQKGTFHMGKLHGQGMLITRDLYSIGQKYRMHIRTEGKFEHGNLNYGKVTFSDGTHYEGNFVKGILTQSMGNDQVRKIHQWGTIEEGHFINDVLNGNGKSIEGCCIKEGEFQDGQLHGQGKIRYDKHFSVEGIFEKGELKKGKMISRNTIMEGEFKDGQLHGRGKIIKNNIITEEGIFEHGKLVRG